MNTTFLKIAKEIALGAGQILRSFWGKLDRIQQKQYYWDLVTEADLASEAYILEELHRHFPAHQILSEEAGLTNPCTSKYQWLVDPLDGTTNFTHQYPMVSVSIGLLVDAAPTIGVVYNPILDELFLATLGEGATFNGKKISVSNVDHLEKSLLATGFAYDRKENPDNNYKEFCHLTQKTQGVRRGGSAAIDLSYVACGRLDGFWERGLKPWDIAAGALLVTEAGGKVTSYEGDKLELPSGRILAANPLIHSQLIQELSNAKK